MLPGERETFPDYGVSVSRIPLFESRPVVATDTTGPLYSGACIFGGWALHASGATGLSVTFYDGADTSGNYIGFLSIAAGAISLFSFPGNGMRLKQGLYMVIGTGAAFGSIFLYPGIPE